MSHPHCWAAGSPPSPSRSQSYKDEGRIRHIGITTTSGSQYPDLLQVMQEYPLDFVSVDYAIDNRQAAEEVFEFDASTWAQFMLKFVVTHPAVTVAAPGTSDPEHMIDNLGGGRGRLPTEDHLARMIELVEGLPEAD
ncbi:MAG: hypothetical protein WD960_04115 [Gemmatimonadota bacterium]